MTFFKKLSIGVLLLCWGQWGWADIFDRLSSSLVGTSSVTYSPDGTRVASVAENYSTGKYFITIWDVTMGSYLPLMTFKEILGEITSLAYSPDGTRIVSGNANNTLKIWDSRTGQELMTLVGHTTSVNAVAYSPDGTRIVSGAGEWTQSSKELKIWDAQTGNILMTLYHADNYDPNVFPPEKINSVTYSPDGTKIISGSDDGTLKVWDAQTGNQLMALDHTYLETNGFESDDVNSITYSPDGSHIASLAGWNGFSSSTVIIIWNAQTGQKLMTLKSDHPYYNQLAYSPDGTTLFSSRGDLWSTQTGKKLTTFGEYNLAINHLAISPDGTKIISGSERDINALQLWNAQTLNKLMTLEGHTDYVTATTFSSDGKQIASGSADKTVKVWDIQTGNVLITLTGHRAEVNAITYSPDEKKIASAAGYKDFFHNVVSEIKIWDAQSGNELMTLETEPYLATSIAFSPDGTRIVSGSGDNANTWEGELVSSDNTLKIWDAQTGTELMTWYGHTDDITDVAYSPNGTRIVSSSNDNTLKIWDAQTGKLLMTLTGHTSAVNSAAYSPDGTRIVSTGSDNTVKIWDAQTGTALMTFNGHTRYATDATYSPDGLYIYSSSKDRTIKKWLADGSNLASITNISTRAYTNTGLNSIIAGFVIQGSGACDVMIRGFGKGIGLSPNLDTQLLLQTFPDANSLAQNSSWQTGNPVASIPVHLHLPDPTDAGIFTRLNAGAYTATMTPEGMTGIGLIGVDEVSCDATTKLVNISTRAEDRTGAETMIAGFIVEGEGTIKVMIRGFGSGLGLSSCLDTRVKLQKFPSEVFVASNDNWQTAANASQIPAALRLPNASDAGLLIDLPAGAYTAVMTPKTGSCNGIGLIGVDVVQ